MNQTKSIPISAKIVSAQEAISLIDSGMTLGVCGAGGVQEPDLLIETLARRFKDTGAPRNLVEFHPIRTGEIEGRGTSLFGAKGLLKRIIGGSFWPVGTPEIIQRISAGEIEAYNFSIGIMYALLEAAAAGRPGVISKTGIDTFVDPRQGGGALNSISTQPMVEDIMIDGERHLFYRTSPLDIAFIRATAADPDGNLIMDEEPAVCAPLLLAQAARTNGGKVIAQVKRIVERGSINPHHVTVPGILVDAIVVHPDQMQITNVEFDPTLVGQAKLDLTGVPAPEAGPRKVIMRRAFLEANPGEVVAIGFGLPGFLPAIANEEGVFDQITFTVEHGVIGGMNGYAAGGKTFPVAHNPTAIIDASDQLRMYSGGGIDRAYLGVGEIDGEGNVNVSLFGGIIPGTGGFIDMTQGIKRICFCAYLGDRPDRKFVSKVQQITFSGRRAQELGQDITYITEKAVFKLGPEGLVLSEYAPGERPEDVVARLNCQISISPDVRQMPEQCFVTGNMSIKSQWEYK